MLKKFFKEYIVYGFSLALNSAMGIFTMPIVTRALSKDDYGLIQLIASFLAIATPSVQVGLNSGIIYYFNKAENLKEKSNYVSTYIISFIGSSLLFSIVMIATYKLWQPLFFKNNEQALYLKLIMIILLGFSFKLTLQGISNVLRLSFQQKEYLFVNNGFKILYLVIIYSIWYFLKIDLLSYYYANLIALIIVLPIALYCIKKQFVLQYSFEKLIRMVKFGLPVLYNQVLNMFKIQVNTWIILAILGLTYVADFGFAMKLGMIFGVVSGAFRTTWAPFIYAEKDEGKAKQITVRLFITFNMLFLYLATFVNFISPELVRLMGSEKYAGTFVYIFPIALMNMLATLSLILITGFGLKAKLKHYYWISPIQFILTIVVNLILIRFFKIYGVLSGNIVIAILYSVLVNHVVQKFYPIQFPWLKIFAVNIIFITVNMFILFAGLLEQLSILYKLIIFMTLLQTPFLFNFVSYRQIINKVRELF